MKFLRRPHGWLTSSLLVLVLSAAFSSFTSSSIGVGELNRDHLRNANKPLDQTRDIKEQRGGREAKAEENEYSEKQIEALVTACFSELFSTSGQGLSPRFVVGDFNGDGVQDVFFPVRLAGAVNSTDRTKPKFNLQMVLGTGPLPKEKDFYDLRIGDLSMDHDGPYFATIHGAGKSLTRSCLPLRDRFILIYAMDKGSTRIRLYRGKKLPPGRIGDPDEEQPPPTLKGSAILLLDNHNIGTALYWDGSRYRWYPFTGYSDDFR